MPTVSVGNSTIPYTVRRSARARRLRLVVRPGKVEIVAPVKLADRRIDEFVQAKRRWLYDKTEALRERALVAVPERFVSGAKVLFRGRFLRLRVESVAGGEPSLRYASACAE